MRAAVTARRIGYVLKRFPRLSETFIAAELLEMQRQGEHVMVFAVNRPREHVRHAFLDELAVPVVYLPYRPLGEPVRVIRALVRAVRRNPSGWLAAARQSVWPPRRKGVRRLLQAGALLDEAARAEVDHLHAHFATTAARLANLTWRMGGPTYSVTTHAKDIWHEEVQAEHLRDKLGPASFVATVTPENRDHLVSLGLAPPAIHVVPNAVDLRRFPAGAERNAQPDLVLTVARLVEKKGLADLVEACAILAASGRPVRLEVAGDGPERERLETVARRAGLDATFHGPLPQERVLELYQRAAVFALPCVVATSGDRDGLPTAALEAMALGVPVVTTAVNGLAGAVLDGETGLVVPQRDPKALAAAVARILDDPAFAARLAGAARRHVERQYSLAASVAQLRTLFPA